MTQTVQKTHTRKSFSAGILSKNVPVPSMRDHRSILWEHRNKHKKNTTKHGTPMENVPRGVGKTK